tara:strand:+ start:165 stop:515 length:351 start_codon:yes stop_codon:yes gene_type:complete
MKEYIVESESWYKNIKLPNKNEETPNKNEGRRFVDIGDDGAAEAATRAVESFFNGDIKLRSWDKPMSISSAILVREKERGGIYVYYSPRILANAGLHDEATKLHEKIINRNYESKV